MPRTAKTRVEATLEIEAPRPLSASALWAAQRRFFERQGILAWRRGKVPHYITSNAAIAKAYATVVLAFVRESAASRAPREPIYVVELGAGSGRFSYHFIKQLFARLEPSRVRDARVVHVMTDVAAPNLGFWRAHPSLRPLVAAGKLDFARFDAETDSELVLLESGEHFSAARPAGPVVLIANYVFDGIRQDLFHCKGGVISECLVGLASDRPGALDGGDPFAHLAFRLARCEARSDRYAEPAMVALLERYRARLEDDDVLIPTAALKCVERFSALSGGRLLVLSADRGCEPNGALGRPFARALAVHGSFSLPVNYDALTAFTEQPHGVALRVHRLPELHLTALLFGVGLASDSETRQAFADAMGDFGPGDHYLMKKHAERTAVAMSAEQMLAILRLGAWDAGLLRVLLPTLSGKLAASVPATREQWREALQRVWDLHFHIGETYDLAFELSALCIEMEWWDDAIAFCRRSIDLCGADASPLYNEALGHFHLGDRGAALDCIDRALELDPELEGAALLRHEIAALAEAPCPDGLTDIGGA